MEDNLRRVVMAVILWLSAAGWGAAHADSWTDTERSLLDSCYRFHDNRRMAYVTDFGRQLQAAGRKSGNREAEDYGLAYRLTGTVMSYSSDPVAPMVSEATARIKALSGKAPSASCVHLMLSMAIYHYSYMSDFNKASGYALKALESATGMDDPMLKVRALSLLTSIYWDKGDGESLKWARECERVSRNVGNSGVKYVTATNMASSLFMHDSIDAAARYLAEADSIAEATGMPWLRFYLDSFHAEIMNARGDHAGAEEYFRRALRFHPDNTAYDRWYADVSFAFFLSRRKRYSEALHYFEEAEREIAGCRQPTTALFALGQKALCLEALGRYKEALEAFKEYESQYSERTALANEREFKSLELKYHVEAKNRENDRQKLELAEKQRAITVVMSICAVLLVILLAVGLVHVRTLRYYRRIVNINLSALNREKHLRKELAEALRGSEAMADNADRKKQERSDVIYLQLDRLMEEKKLYRDPSLTLDTLASVAGTNRTYLQEAIKLKTGMTYSGYINDLRINEAIELLSSASSPDIMKTVASSVGFESASNFYRIFRKKVGMSPAMFRQQALQQEQ